ncbi:DUF4296 domain-containing protein [Mucilaginibacter sp. PPCGB 2223]|uniref:DUF4296 domain-containing protein n=1 Tax=Mucilaginibacter sp. PPCGB 2223 TaxID=1886027 RepID=UPI0015860C7C|nr:DUF4296 domain-containing protein [Mucilaginibacter sp. PPCGB 2223]
MSCNESSDYPGGLTMPQTAEVLTDIHIVNGSLYNISNQPDSILKHGMGLYSDVFKLHHTDSATFRRSLLYYSQHPDVLYVIYEGVQRRLNKKLDSLKKIKAHLDAIKHKDPNFVADSIKAKKKADSLAAARAKHIQDSIMAANRKSADEAKKLQQFHNSIKFKNRKLIPVQ